MVPFDSAKLDRLMAEAGVDLLLASTRHNVRYLTGGYYYHFHAHAARMGLSQYLPFVGVPRGRVEETFYVCRAEERGQIEAEGLWIPNQIDAIRGTIPAAEAAVNAIERLGLAAGAIGVELSFLPADAFLALQHGLPTARLVDATPILDELRAVKIPQEIIRLRSIYDRLAGAIQAAFAAGTPGITTAEIARLVEREIVRRDMGFLYALVCAGPGTLRAPSSARWERGCILHIDAGGEEEDYLADICRVGCLGEPSPLAQELHTACLGIQEAARREVRPGVPCQEILLAGERALGAHRLAAHGRFVVHGIGMVSHEQPRVSRENARKLEAGMVLSIETDFIHPEVGHLKIEDAVAVTENGSEGLGDAGRGWHVVPV